ncbi:MAG: type II toxin-antitoxin system HicB family antitoxin [Dehalococcoidia bacterium]
MARYTVLVHYDPDEQVYLVSIPALGTATDGRTLDEAVANAKDALEGGLATLVQYERDVPEEPSLPIVMSLDVDLDAIRREVAAEAVRPGG